jgi:hypothetical protein
MEESLFSSPPPAGLFGSGDDREEQDRLLTLAYVNAGRTLDDLPYTPEFERIYQTVGQSVGQAVSSEKGLGSRAEVFRRLHTLRKAAKLPRLGRAASSTVRVTAEEEALLATLIIERVGTLGQRDRLPYDPRIDDLAQVFNERTGRALSAHDLWRLVAKLAK